MALSELKNVISEFDYESGMAYCGEDEEFFLEMLSDYVDSGRDELLPKLYEAKDWVNYEIEVHALKSTSRMMGFPLLGDKCEVLQNAAAAKDEATLNAKHGEMMSSYEKILMAVRNEIG
ncbi:MAG: Hpt domain-containing protein [Lachnospiraceae bacterium]|nr:Hpt domain-containing protein [Lachnospiraceae bacterium]